MNSPKHRYFVHPVEPENAAALMERMEREGFEIVSASSHVFMVQAGNGVVPLLNMMVTARIPFGSERTALEAEFQAKQDAIKNSRIIPVGRG